MQKESITSAIPFGFVFYSADFSIRIQRGCVVIRRSREDYVKWMKLSDSDRDKVPLYYHGFGWTLEEAIQDVVNTINEDPFAFYFRD